MSGKKNRVASPLAERPPKRNKEKAIDKDFYDTTLLTLSESETPVLLPNPVAPQGLRGPAMPSVLHSKERNINRSRGRNDYGNQTAEFQRKKIERTPSGAESSNRHSLDRTDVYREFESDDDSENNAHEVTEDFSNGALTKKTNHASFASSLPSSGEPIHLERRNVKDKEISHKTPTRTSCAVMVQSSEAAFDAEIDSSADYQRELCRSREQVEEPDIDNIEENRAQNSYSRYPSPPTSSLNQRGKTFNAGRGLKHRGGIHHPNYQRGGLSYSSKRTMNGSTVIDPSTISQLQDSNDDYDNDLTNKQPSSLIRQPGLATRTPPPKHSTVSRPFEGISAEEFAKFRDKTKFEFAYIRQQLKEIGEEVEKIAAMMKEGQRLKQFAEAEAAEDEFDLPLATTDAVRQLEIYLDASSEARHRLMKLVSLRGGKGLTEIIKRILGKLFNNYLSTVYTWTGVSSKPGVKKEKFEALRNIRKVIYGAVRSQEGMEKTTDNQIDEETTEWLRHGKARLLKEQHRLAGE